MTPRNHPNLSDTMRTKFTDDLLTVQAFAGTHVVMLGMSLPAAEANNLLGFGILRTDHLSGESYWMRGYKTFEGVGELPAPGVTVSTRQHPLQSFQWADYSAKPGQRYTYKVAAMRGTPGDLNETEMEELELTS